MDAPQPRLYPEAEPENLMVVFGIISHRSWDELQGWRDALPGSYIEPIMYGLYVLIVPPGGARRLAG